MSGIYEHPGYLRITSEGITAMHADWPMYPEEHGPDLALLWLTAYPPGTVFHCIDDIDRCVLFLAAIKGANLRYPFDNNNFHVAIWHEDLLKLQEAGWIEGVAPVSQRHWETIQRRQLLKRIQGTAKQAEPQEQAEKGFVQSNDLHYKLPDGTYKTLTFSSLDGYDDRYLTWPEFSSEGVTVTQHGNDHAIRILARALARIPALDNRVKHLLRLSYFDIAVREVCVGIEHLIRTSLGSERWGVRLVDELICELRSRSVFRESELRTFRSQARTSLKFIRNEFMHKVVAVDEVQGKALLFRLLRVKSALAAFLARSQANAKADRSARRF